MRLREYARQPLTEDDLDLTPHGSNGAARFRWSGARQTRGMANSAAQTATESIHPYDAFMLYNTAWHVTATDYNAARDIVTLTLAHKVKAMDAVITEAFHDGTEVYDIGVQTTKDNGGRKHVEIRRGMTPSAIAAFLDAMSI